MGAGPARRFNAVGDHALSQIKKGGVLPFLPLQLQGLASGRRLQAHPASASMVIFRLVLHRWLYLVRRTGKSDLHTSTTSPRSLGLGAHSHSATIAGRQVHSVVHWYNCHAFLPCVAQATNLQLEDLWKVKCTDAAALGQAARSLGTFDNCTSVQMHVQKPWVWFEPAKYLMHLTSTH